MKKRLGWCLAWIFPVVAFCDSVRDQSANGWGYGVAETGYFWSRQGKEQHIGIQGLIGDQFTVTRHSSGNGFVGLGLFMRGMERRCVEVDYGLDVFYLAKTSVQGDVVQEDIYTNLSYQYDVTHYPFYAMCNMRMKTRVPWYAVDVNFGLGPSIMHLSDFTEIPLIGTAVSDQIFSSHTQAAFSLTVGAAMEFYRVLGPLSFEVGYRFFYLGQGTFKNVSSQVANPLSTGNCYANALTVSVKL